MERDGDTQQVHDDEREKQRERCPGSNPSSSDAQRGRSALRFGAQGSRRDDSHGDQRVLRGGERASSLNNHRPTHLGCVILGDVFAGGLGCASELSIVD